MYWRIVNLLLILVLPANLLYAQIQESNALNRPLNRLDDTSYNSNSRYLEEDTTLTLADRHKRFISRLERWSKEDKWPNKWVKNFLVFDRKESVERNLSKENESFKKYDPWKNKVIRKIEFKVYEPLGYDLNNPNRKPISWVEKAANTVHTSTRKFIIRNLLLFKENELLEPIQLSESERLIRTQDYIYDARVNLRKVKGSNDSIDVVVSVQDVFAFSGSISLGLNPFNFIARVSDRNFAGLGARANFALKYSPLYPNNINADAEYIVNNLGASFVTGRIYHLTDPNNTLIGIGANRDFITPLISWGGGANFNFVASRLQLSNDTSLRFLESVQQDAWLGYATNFKGESNNDRTQQKNYVFAGRVVLNEYLSTPITDTLGLFRDNTQFFFSAAFTKRKFFKDNFIFGFGRTEDVPTGMLAEVITGYQIGGGRSYPYFAFRGGYTLFTEEHRLMNFSFQAGGFRAPNRWVLGQISASIFNYSKLVNIGTWRFRGFNQTRWVSLNDGQLTNRFIDLNNNNGIRGLNLGGLIGTHKIVSSWEGNFYPPINFLGFRMALVGFIDVGVINNDFQKLLEGPLFQSYGVGFRFRNENLIFPTFQISLSFIPRGKEQNDFVFFARSTSFFNYDPLLVGRPGLLISD